MSELVFKIDRKGQFEIQLAEGNECGLAGKLGFNYEFQFQSTELDERNFVVDHHEVDEAIQEWSRANQYRGACEQLAVAIGEIVLAHVHIGSRLPQAYPYLTVKIVGSGVASISVSGTPKMFKDFSPKFAVLPLDSSPKSKKWRK